MFTLDDILKLVGTLDDSPGEDTPRERFRHYLRESVVTLAAVRDYIDACIRNKGPKYDHALQDLVNHSAHLIGFEVDFGRYRGVTNDVGYDGLWRWNNFTIVAEVKTTDAYSIKTATLVGYVDRLISESRIADWDHAVGLYVVARPDAQLTQLANSIVAEKRTQQLRIATVENILSLAELVQEEHVTADEAVALLRPAGVYVAETVELLARIAATAEAAPVIPAASTGNIPPPPTETLPIATPTATPKQSRGQQDSTVRTYLMTPVRNEGEHRAKETIKRLVGAG